MGSHSSSPPPLDYTNPYGGSYAQGGGFSGFANRLKQGQQQGADWQNKWNAQNAQGLQVATPVQAFGQGGGDPSMGIITNENRNLAPSSFGTNTNSQSPYFNANYR